MVVLEATNICKQYGNKWNKQEVLKGLDLTIEKGEFVSIMGASGSGKTTFSNVLSSIDQVTSGTIIIDGKDITTMKERELAWFRQRHLGFVFQNITCLRRLLVKENILLPLSVMGAGKKEADEAFRSVATELGIYELKDKYPNELSGGQKQRTSAARAFIHQPSMIFADEPTGALDSKSATDLLNKLTEFNQKYQATILMVTHDAAAASFSSPSSLLKMGKCIQKSCSKAGRERDHYEEIMKTQAILGGIKA